MIQDIEEAGSSVIDGNQKPREVQDDEILRQTQSECATSDHLPGTEQNDSDIGKSRPLLWAWIALVIAVLACSSGGVWFILLTDTPAILRASWRLCLTSVMQFPGFVYDYRKASLETRSAFHGAYLRIMLAGCALAVHFCAWSLSLDMTSLSHSLLFVCTTPILLVTFQGLAFLICSRLSVYFDAPPSPLEVIGSLIGFVAAGILAQEAAATTTEGNANPQTDPSLAGDLIATLGAAAMGVYLQSGASLRRWMPVWLYVFPVTLFAGLLSGLFSIAFEERTRLGGF